MVGMAGARTFCNGVCAALPGHDSGCCLGSWSCWRLPHGGQHGVFVCGGHSVSQGRTGDRCMDLGDPLGYLGIHCFVVHLPAGLLKLLACSTNGARHVRDLSPGTEKCWTSYLSYLFFFICVWVWGL